MYELQVRIREIPVLDKLQYLYCLLSAVLPVVKQIHQIQCSEVELEKRLRGKKLLMFQKQVLLNILYVTVLYHLTFCLFFFPGNEIDLVRAKLSADEQMCWYYLEHYMIYMQQSLAFHEI